MKNLKQFSDKDILQRLANNDESALRAVYEEYSEKLFISAYNLLNNKEICEDIIQEIFISLWRKRQNLSIKTTLKGYLYACVTYKVYDQYKIKNSALKTELIDNFNNQIQFSNPETNMVHNELVERINSIINTLPKKCQVVFKMSREELLSHKEIAQKLNISTKTIESHITNALKIIRSSLGNSYSAEIILFIYIYSK